MWDTLLFTKHKKNFDEAIIDNRIVLSDERFSMFAQNILKRLLLFTQQNRTES